VGSSNVVSILDAEGKPLARNGVSLTTLDSLSKAVTAGQIALPEFQRPQVWNDQERKELVISLCLGVPIGSYLLWEYNQNIQTNVEIIEFPGISTTKEKVQYLLVDGQQRMSTISELKTSLFGKSYKVEFRKISSELTRPILHKIPKIKDNLDYVPDINTIDESREIQLSKLAGNTKLTMLEDDAEKVANRFRLSMKDTTVPVHLFDENEKRQWVLYVYQTCNLAGKSLSDTDHAEAALGYVYPELKEKIDKYVKNVKLWDSQKILTTRKLVLRSILDELYNSPHFSYCKKNGLDVLNPRIINIKSNINKKIDEDSTPLKPNQVKKAFNLTKKAFTRLEDLITGFWQMKSNNDLGENELLVMLAWYRENLKKKTKISKEMVGKMSKNMMLSMALKSTTGGNTQAKTVGGCNLVRASPSSCWEKIKLEWGYDEIKQKDLGITDAETTQKSTSSFIFHLYKLSLFRDEKAVDLFDSTAITFANTDKLQLDHFYPRSKLGILSDNILNKRRNHLANYVIMKGWSNNSKKTIMPNDLINNNNLWPKRDDDKKANFEAHCIPNTSQSNIWLPKADENFTTLSKLRSEINRFKNKIANASEVSETEKNILEKDIATREAEMSKISRTLEINFKGFLNNRSGKISTRINKMLNEIETKGF
tara:strand:- start:184 stop:2142 length:1959 start_codon:yes stop_codon:yes gene_type:complete